MAYQSITLNDTTEDFGLQVARGQVEQHTVRHIFGFNPDVDSAAEETIWTPGGIYTSSDTAIAMTVSSSSADDTSSGTGARTVYILGINGDGSEVSEIITLNGQTAVTTTKMYTDIQTVTVLTAGSGGVNAGKIYVGSGTVTAGVPAVVYGEIDTGENQSLSGHLRIPAGYTGFLIKGSISSGSATNGYLTGKLKLRMPDGIRLTAAIVTLYTGTAEFDFKYPIKIPAGATIYANAKTTKDNEAVASYFQVLLIKEYT
jgi:hypothetical protein